MNYREQIQITKNICLSFSNKTGIPFENLFSECLEKLPKINDNFIPQLGKKFPPYLKASLRGYLRNYVRDKSFTVKIPRRISDIYMKTKKYSSFTIASLHTDYTVKEIETAHEIIQKFRTYNTHDVKPWTVEKNTLSVDSDFDISKEIIDEADVNIELLLDFYVYELSDDELQIVYGSDYKSILKDGTSKIKQTCQAQGLYST